MRKIIKEISKINIDDKEKEKFMRLFIDRTLEKDERSRQILLNAIKEITKNKKGVYSQK